VGSKDADSLISMFKAAQQLIKEKELKAFRLAFNGGAYQHVPHLHWHLLAGRTIEWSKL
jgi:diadenosine tetraphosphate (Ap4A) HIT family hydrolase